MMIYDDDLPLNMVIFNRFLFTRGYLFIEFGLVSAASESITHGMPPVVPV